MWVRQVQYTVIFCRFLFLPISLVTTEYEWYPLNGRIRDRSGEKRYNERPAPSVLLCDDKQSGEEDNGEECMIARPDPISHGVYL
jgi:hypothetical protein